MPSASSAPPCPAVRRPGPGRTGRVGDLRLNGLAQAQVAAVMGGVSQARVSQIEHGKVTEVDAIRGYVEALGGTVDVVARVGDWTVRVA
jgi:predicted transcriptional regulator